MLEQLIRPYLLSLDDTLQALMAAQFRDEEGFGVMLRYAMGWVNADGEPYHKPTGKRLRPILLLLVAEASGADWRVALPAAAAVELLHNFSLIHDDIQDNSPLRHGRPTVWNVWGIPNAINAGDAMFTMAYIALQSLQPALSAATMLRLWSIFNTTNLELTRGQHLDMRFEQQSAVSEAAYISMITGKSAALLAACAEMGALIATSDQTLASHYAQFGLNIGIAFQIHDDILGIWGDPAITGKSTATDIVSRKKSLPVLFGMEQSAGLTALYKQDQPFTEAQVLEVLSLLNSVGAEAYARQQESLYYERAMQSLAQVSQSIAPSLLAFVDFLFNRNR